MTQPPEGVGLVDLSAGERLLFQGPQALWFLDQLVTNRVLDLPAGRGIESLLLTPKGRIAAAMRIFHVGERALAQIEPGAEPLGDFFRRRVFATKVRIESVSDQTGVVRILGTGAAGVLKSALDLEALPQVEHSCLEWESGFVTLLAPPLEGFDLFGERETLSAAVDALSETGAVMLSPEEYDKRRVVAGVARFGVDFGEGHLPQEAALERAVHFKKGCYLGQESVAMAQRGRVKKRVRHLHFEGRPRLGRIRHQETDSGAVTSIATVDGAGFGIGTLSTATPVGARVRVDGSDGSSATAVVHELPNTPPGPQVPSARELRERLQAPATST